jgi:3,4-dihydroxy 2-butanone 4-phosphate synthase/GTP cyclohydrolase II
VLCEVMNSDGTMARGVQLQALCRRHDLPMVTVEEIAAHLNVTTPAITAV